MPQKKEKFKKKRRENFSIKSQKILTLVSRYEKCQMRKSYDMSRKYRTTDFIRAPICHIVITRTSCHHE
jgi:hypothetical protein